MNELELYLAMLTRANIEHQVFRNWTCPRGDLKGRVLTHVSAEQNSDLGDIGFTAEHWFDATDGQLVAVGSYENDLLSGK
jgi:hypothetical protein